MAASNYGASGSPRSWRAQKQARATSPAQRWIRRVLFTLLGVGLLALLIWWLIPVRGTRTHLAYVRVDYTDLEITPTAFGQQDFQLLDDHLRHALCAEQNRPCPTRLTNPQGAASIETLAAELRALVPEGDQDVLICYLKFQGISDSGKAYVLNSDFDARLPGAGRAELGQVLRSVNRVPTKATLLVLDCGQVTNDVRLGMLVNEFPRLVADEVASLQRSNLWVLSSHRLLERSHHSYSQQRSLLAEALADGLSASADGFGERNEPNGEIDLKELYDYVSDRVASSAQRSYARSQRPLLLRAGVGSAEPEKEFLARVVARRKSSDADDSEAQVAEAADSATPAQGDRSPTNEAPAAETGASVGSSQQGDEPSVAGKPDATESTGEAEPSTEEHVLALLHQAWSLREAAEQRSGGSRSPVDAAPHLWRRAAAMLVYYEQLYRAGSAAEVNTEDLKEGIGILESLVQGTARSRPTAGRGLLAETLDRVHEVVQAAPRVVQPRSFAMARLGVGLGPSAQVEQRFALQKQYEQWMAADAAEMPVAEPQTDPAESSGAAVERGAEGEANEGDSAGEQTGDAETVKPRAVVRFRDWAQQAAAREPELVELRFAAKLADLSDRVPWEILAEALKTRYQAEEAAAVAVECTPWVRQLVDVGDRRREAVERELFVAAAGVQDRLRNEFQQVRAIYEQALDAAQVIHSATGLANDVLWRAPDYVRWHVAANWERSGRQPTQQQLHDLFERLASLREQLENPQEANVESIRRLAGELAGLRDRVERATEVEGLLGRWEESGAVRDAEDLLSTALLSAPQRRRLLEALSQFAADPIDFEPLGSAYGMALTNEDWDRLADRAALELKLAELGQVSKAAGADTPLAESFDELRARFQEFQTAAGAGANDEQRWTACRALGKALEGFYTQLPSAIREEAELLTDLSDPGSRPARQRRLVRLARTAALIDARDELEPNASGANPIVQAHAAQLFDLLLWHRRRLLPPPEEQLCPPQAELEFLVAAASAYGRQAEGIARQPDVGRSVAVERYFEVSAESQVPLAGAAASPVNLRLVARDSFTGRGQTWIVLHYDREVLNVSSDEVVVYEGSTELDVLGRAPSLALLPGESRVVPLSVSAAGDVGREQARLVVRVVFAGPYLVHETVTVDVALPVVDLVVRATAPGTVRDGELETGTMVLRPFPNVATPYQFGVVNRSGKAKRVSVELLALPEPPEGQRAWFAVPVDEEGTWQSAGAQPQAISLAESQFELAPDARPVWLKLAPPAAAAPPPADPAGGAEAQPAAAQNAANRLPIRHGMLCVIRPEGAKALVKHLRIEPLHPIEYLESRARFSLDDERIDVEVSPADPQRRRMPTKGSQVEWKFRDDDPIEPDAPRLPFGEVTQQQNARLDLVTAEDPTKNVLVRLTVDGYPRAFVHPVNCGVQRDVPPDTNRREIRILNPVDGAAFRAPRDTIRVALEVDAPLGAFQTPGNRVEIGIDSNRNRQLDASETEHRLYFDRQVGVFLDDIADDGFFKILPTVRDFQLDVSIPRVTNRRVPLLAQLLVDGTLERSAPVEIILDGAAPRVQSLAVDPPEGVRQGNPLHVSAVVDDGNTQGGASGIENVLFAFGLRNAEFDEEKAVPGSRLADGQWSATLETADLQAGRPYHVLVRATDNVGLLSAVARTGVISIRPPPRKPIVEEPVEEVPKLYTIGGTVSYGEPIVGAEVELFEIPEEGEAKSLDKVSTDEAGRFTFGKRVGPGTYTVVAAGSVKNRRRRGAQTISLQGDSPKVSVPIKLQ